MKKIFGVGLALGVCSLAGFISSDVNAYTVDEAGEYAVNFSYNIYDDGGVAMASNKIIRLDVVEGDVIEVGSLLTDLGFTADSPEKPKNPKSESGSYYWKIAGGENAAVETISKENFTGFCKVEEGVTISKCARLEVVFPDAAEDNSIVIEEVDAGQSNMLDGVTGAEINFQKAMPSGSVLTVQELLANDMIKGEIPPTLKKILNLAVMRENGEEVEVSGNEMTIALALPEDLIEFKYFQIVYIVDGEIKETFPAEVIDGKIVFKTTHLSAYGIQASNKPFATTESSAPVMAVVDSPDTGVESFDMSAASSSKVVPLIVFAVSFVIFGGVMIWRKKRSHRIRL